jgi:hypothetical protein
MNDESLILALLFVALHLVVAQEGYFRTFLCDDPLCEQNCWNRTNVLKQCMVGGEEGTTLPLPYSNH